MPSPCCTTPESWPRWARRADLAVTSPPYWSAQNYQRLHWLSFRVLGLDAPGRDEIGRRAADYLADLDAVIVQLTHVLSGHFARPRGVPGGHSRASPLPVRRTRMRLKDTFARQVLNHAFFAKAVKREFVYVFDTPHSRHATTEARRAQRESWPTGSGTGGRGAPRTPCLCGVSPARLLARARSTLAGSKESGRGTPLSTCTWRSSREASWRECRTLST